MTTPRDIARDQQNEVLIRNQAERRDGGMSDADLILQMHLIHWRLRLRSPATVAEKRAWHGVMTELRRRFPGQALASGSDKSPSTNVQVSPESCPISYLEFGSWGIRAGARDGFSAVGESR